MRTCLLVLTGFLTVILSNTPAPAQLVPGLEIQRTIVTPYSPDTPWTEGRIFQKWIGHGGCFYNCDCEEQKRHSPYIDWKTGCRNETRRTGLGVLQHDIAEVKARVRAGSCKNPCWPRQLCTLCGDSGNCGTCQTPGTQPSPGWNPMPLVFRPESAAPPAPVLNPLVGANAPWSRPDREVRPPEFETTAPAAVVRPLQQTRVGFQNSDRMGAANATPLAPITTLRR